MFFKNATTFPIPRLMQGKWKEVPITECGEPLVPLGPFLSCNGEEGFLEGKADIGFSDRIFTDAIYWGERESSPYKQGELDDSLLTIFIRESVANKLVEAASYLPEGHALLIWDGYRPLSVQKALYDDYYQQLINKKGKSPEEATIEAQKFVSIPSHDPTRPSPHNTGAAVDLTIIRFASECLLELDCLNRMLKSTDWKEQYNAEMRRIQLMCESSIQLNMGTKFDAVMDQTATRYYEEKLDTGSKLLSEETEILKNRRLLNNVMQHAGFSNYPEEWWHFDFGNQFDANRTNRSAIYGAAVLTQECKDWEKMRVDHYKYSLRWRGTTSPMTKVGDPELIQIVREATCSTGHPRYIQHDKAQRLEA